MTAEGRGARGLSWPSGPTVTRSIAPDRSSSIGELDGSEVWVQRSPGASRLEGEGAVTSQPRARHSVMARATRSSSPGRSRRPFSRTMEVRSVAAAVATAM